MSSSTVLPRAYATRIRSFGMHGACALRQAEQVVPAVDRVVEHAAARVAIWDLQLRSEAARPGACDRHARLARFGVDDQLLRARALHERGAGPVEIGRDRPRLTRDASGQRGRQPEAGEQGIEIAGGEGFRCRSGRNQQRRGGEGCGSQNQTDTNAWMTLAPNVYSGSVPAARKFGSEAGNSEKRASRKSS